MTALIITNIILAVVVGLDAVLRLIDNVKNKRPIIIKEAGALRSYYEEKLKDAEKKAEKAESNYAEYKRLYERELQEHRDANGLANENSELKLRTINLEGKLSSCVDRIEAMAQENAELKKKIKELRKPAKKGKNERAKV